MNKDAEAWIDNCVNQFGSCGNELRAAMEWAYRDAAEQCRSLNGRAICLGGSKTAMDLCAAVVEARLK